jgi:HD-GYP domain-containing protein (c-di-GMP phosphodiesterase class II)
MVHDVGKIVVPAEILAKPGRLTTLEMELIRHHSQEGHDLLAVIECPWPLAAVALQHHERMDGSGYPGGLRGDELLLESRIIAVADVVEAMASDRPYRPALGIAAAVAEIEAGRGVLYDAAVCDVCLETLAGGFVFDE